ncbi:AC3_0185 family rSAM-modified Cys-rich RiPP [Paenibacillus riograndensis]|uniref:AC3_0185 family rSAM-modified Cys-rich RiPP n=1 Tax=Paenibacillus TaxID=44249 RepID=UPI0009E3FB1C
MRHLFSKTSNSRSDVQGYACGTCTWGSCVGGCNTNCNWSCSIGCLTNCSGKVIW